MEDICKQLFALARPFLTVRHNQRHTEICFDFAVQLLEHLGGREEIVLPAIILHDVGWSVIPADKQLLAFGPKGTDKELNRIHEIEGSKIAARILQQVPLGEEDCIEICRIVERHDSGKSPSTLEEKMVKDADKLFRFSPEGFKIDVERFAVNANKYWDYLNNIREEWFFMDYSKELAARELKKVKAFL